MSDDTSNMPNAEADPTTASSPFDLGRDTQRVLSSRQLAQWLRIPQAELEERAEEGEIPGRRVAGRWRFGALAINRWVQGLPVQVEDAQPNRAMTARLENLLDQLEKALPSKPKGDVIAEAGVVRFVMDELVPLETIENAYIAYVMARMEGNKTTTAEVLGLDPSTLYRRLGRMRSP